MDKEEPSESSLQAVVIFLLCCGAVKVLHLLGVITVEGAINLPPPANHCNVDPRPDVTRTYTA